MFSINDIVILKSLHIKGRIINISGNKYTVLLDTNVKVTVKNTDIEKICDDKEKSINNNDIKITYNFNTESFNNEIMIRHQTVLEAIDNVDKFISSAIINKEKRLRIIHGRSGGILRNAVHEYLDSCPFVESYKLADEYEGSIGVTIVYLK